MRRSSCLFMGLQMRTLLCMRKAERREIVDYKNFMEFH